MVMGLANKELDPAICSCDGAEKDFLLRGRPELVDKAKTTIAA